MTCPCMPHTRSDSKSAGCKADVTECFLRGLGRGEEAHHPPCRIASSNRSPAAQRRLSSLSLGHQTACSPARTSPTLCKPRAQSCSRLMPLGATPGILFNPFTHRGPKEEQNKAATKAALVTELICTLGLSGSCVYSTVVFIGLQLACSEPAKPWPLKSDSPQLPGSGPFSSVAASSRKYGVFAR